jgi:hypothetical protein
VADDIQAHFHPKRGALLLACRDDAFVRLRDAIVEEAGLSGTIEGVPDNVHEIQIAKVQLIPSPAGLRDKLALVGCALIGFAVLFVLVAGIATIAGWFR